MQGIYEKWHALYKRRRKADYDLNSPKFRARAAAALDIASAGQIIAIVKRGQQTQDLRHQIRNGIREYERKINP